MEIKEARFLISNTDVKNALSRISRNMHLLAGRMLGNRH